MAGGMSIAAARRLAAIASEVAEISITNDAPIVGHGPDPKFLGDWLADIPGEDNPNKCAVIRWCGEAGPGSAMIPAWVVHRLFASRNRK